MIIKIRIRVLKRSTFQKFHEIIDALGIKFEIWVAGAAMMFSKWYEIFFEMSDILELNRASGSFEFTDYDPVIERYIE